MARIIYEQKAQNGEWIVMDHPFDSQREAGDFCDTMNSASHSFSYRVLVITDPARIAEMEDERTKRLVSYERFMAFMLED